MKRNIWLGLASVVVVVAAVSLIALPRGPEWTTSSPAALEEYELAMEAWMKLYYIDATAHLEKAVELDPDFVMAKLNLADTLKHLDDDRGKALMAEVMEADLEGLTERERFMVERHRAIMEKRAVEAAQMLDQYLEKNPSDPYVLHLAAQEAWMRGDNERGERLNRRLVELSPNWVLAYNQLGYITMLQGRFAEAEEYFTSYRFIAPDQANPHDSLGELYIILGRYDDAVESLETAIEIKPDFFNSYDHLALALAMMGDYEGARAVVDRAVSLENIPEEYSKAMSCWVGYAEWTEDGDWQRILDEQSSGCLDARHIGYPVTATHRAAAQLGDWDIAHEIEDRVMEKLEEAKGKGASKVFDETWVQLRHLQGVRQALQGDLESAERSFREADGQLTYIGAPIGVFKLSNRMALVEVLLAQGRDVDAHKLLSQVRAVNPIFVAEFEEAGLRSLGLDRT